MKIKVNRPLRLFNKFLFVPVVVGLFYFQMAFGGWQNPGTTNFVKDSLKSPYLRWRITDFFQHRYSEEGLVIEGLESKDSENLKLKWKYFETRHLRVIYPEYLFNFSIYASNIAEDVYEKLSETTGFHLKKKVILFISDRGDSPNGYVTVGPRGIYVLIYAIHPYEAISYGLDSYRDWYETLISHEFAHIFHIGERRGVAKFASYIFGQIIYPNGFTPVFYREGFAVNFETIYGGGVGRANSNYTDMYLRTAFSENLYNGDIWIDRFSSKPKKWPFTTGCYLYGASFLKYLRSTYSNKILYKLNYDSSSFYYTPWVGAFKKEAGKSVSDLWSDWVMEESEKQNIRLKEIKDEGVVKFTRISPTNGFVYSVSLSDSGRYACYSISNGDMESGLYIYDFRNKLNRLIKPDLMCCKIFFDEDSNGVFYIREDYNRAKGWIKNLYYLDLKELSEFKLTENGYISDFNFYDKNTLLIVKSTVEGNRLYIAELNWESMKVTFKREIVNPYKGFKAESPNFSPDKKKIVFSIKNLKGSRFIVYATVIKTDNGFEIVEPKLLDKIPNSSYFPKWINNRFLTFINDSNNIYNLYLADLQNEKLFRITNLTTGILDYDVSDKGDIVGKIYGPKGFFVGKWCLSDQKKSDFFSVDSFTIRYIYPPEKQKSICTVKTKSFNQKTYRSISYLLPDYWFPFGVGEGIYFGIGLSTINRDYIGRFSYSFAAIYDLTDSLFKLSLAGNYNFPNFSLFGHNLFYDSIGDYIGSNKKDRGFSFYYGIKKNFISYYKRFGGSFGIIRDLPFVGLRLITEFSNARVSYSWGIPYRGFMLGNDMYMELNYGRWLLNRSKFNFYFPFVSGSIFEIGGDVLTDFGTGSGFVYIGRGLGYLYAPVNGIVSYGYQDIKMGDLALKQIFKVNKPLLKIERGISVFPLYFNSLYGSLGINLYEALSFTHRSAICEIDNLFGSDNGCIMVSLDFSLSMNATIFYDFPFLIRFGYIYAPMRGGVDRLYLSINYSLFNP